MHHFKDKCFPVVNLIQLQSHGKLVRKTQAAIYCTNLVKDRLQGTNIQYT